MDVQSWNPSREAVRCLVEGSPVEPVKDIDRKDTHVKRFVTATMLAGLLALPMAGPAVATHPHEKFEQGPRCGGGFKSSDACSFRFEGGYLYLGGSVRGTALPEGAATVRIEAVSRVTGQRRILLSCTTPGSGACGAAGSYDTTEHVRKGQRLFCIVEGTGRGTYECGTMIEKRNH